MKCPNILIVDDERLVCWSLESYLAKAGFTASIAGTAEKAIELLENSYFNLIITDLKLPKRDGFEVAAAARKIHPGSPVIMISAYGDEVGKESLDRKKIDYFIDKPFNTEEVVDLVKDLLLSNNI